MRFLQTASSLLIVLVIWAGVSALHVFPEAIFPAPWSVLVAAKELYDDGLLFSDLAVSLGRACIGFAIGASLGVAVGLLTGRTRVLRALLNPFLTILRPIPAIALVPVAMVWFGIGEGGADAALLGEHVGSLAPGRKADFLLLDCTGPEVRPRWDFTWEVVRFFDRADIIATFVDGEPVQIGGNSTRFDSMSFLDGAEVEGVQAVRDAGLIKLHSGADAGWPKDPATS
jgi:hypothetical protein